MPPRERLRSKLRRRAEFLVQTGAARRPMTPAEIEHFLTCVENNSPNEFGLVRLSELALDDFLDVERRGYAWDAVRDVGIEGPQTLLAYAAWLGRAWIVRALLRAGADPSARPENRTPGANATPRGHLPNPSPRLVRAKRREPPPSRDTPGHSAETPPSETPRTLGDLTRVMMQQYPESATWLTMAMVHARASAKPRMRENRRDDDFTAACASCATRASSRPPRSRRVATWRARRARGATSSITTARWDAHGGRRGCRTTRHCAARQGRVSRRWLPLRRQSLRRRGSVRRPFRRLRSPAASTTVPKASETSNDPRRGCGDDREELVGVVPRRRGTVGSRGITRVRDPARRSRPTPWTRGASPSRQTHHPPRTRRGVTNRRRVG